MVAESQQSGRGQLEGIVIAAGHESRVKTAIAFEPAGPERLAKAKNDVGMREVSPTPVDQEPSVLLFGAISKTAVPMTPTAPAEVSIAVEPLLQSLLVGQPRWHPDEPAPPSPASPNLDRAGPLQVSQLAAVMPEIAIPNFTGTRIGVVPGLPAVGTLSAHQAGVVLVLVELRAVDATLRMDSRAVIPSVVDSNQQRCSQHIGLVARANSGIALERTQLAKLRPRFISKRNLGGRRRANSNIRQRAGSDTHRWRSHSSGI